MLIETSMIQKLNKNKAQFENFFGFTNFEERELHMLELLYFKQASQINITGKDSSILVSKLQKNKKQSSKKE